VGVLRSFGEAEIITLEPDLDNASAGNRNKILKSIKQTVPERWNGFLF